MKKSELYKKIIDKLGDSNAPHICCLVEKDSLQFSVRCSEEDFYNFLYASCKNIPWAEEVIKDFAEDMDELLKKKTKDVDNTYLN